MSAPREDNVTKYQRYLADEARKEKAAVSAPREEDVEARLERIYRAFEFVPLNLYDEITKLAEGAVGELVAEVARLSGERDELQKTIDAFEDHLEGVFREHGAERERVLICPFCCQGYVPEPKNRHKDRCAGCLDAERLREALETIRNRYSDETVAGRVARNVLDSDDPHIFEPMSATEQRAQGALSAGAEQPEMNHVLMPAEDQQALKDAGAPVRCCGYWPECEHMVEWSAGAEQEGHPAFLERPFRPYPPVDQDTESEDGALSAGAEQEVDYFDPEHDHGA